MADIQSKILSKYGIDIAQENICKLYKIDNADISLHDLEEKIQSTRKKWNTSINGANEKIAERDRARLEKADIYEAILKDDNLRKEIFIFYNKSSGANNDYASDSGECSTEFAREYFELVATTKKIKKSDVDFFFDYYHPKPDAKNAIKNMLSKEMKINIFGKDKKDSSDNENDNADRESQKKNDASPMIVNLFKKETILKLRKSIEKYEEAVKSKELCLRYPKLKEGLFEYLEINDIDKAEKFTEKVEVKLQEIYTAKIDANGDKNAEYNLMLDMLNKLKDIGSYKDVVDNIPEFKLLLKYPNLTPYMFSFVDMKSSTIKGIVNIAKRDYAFRDDTDFILNYYNPIHDNFGISDSGISALLRKAEKKARQNKILNNIDKKLGRKKKKRNIPIGIEIIHWLVYWPIFLVYFLFEVTKVIFTNLHRFSIPVFVILFVLENWLLPKTGAENLLVLRKIFFQDEWLALLKNMLGSSGINWFETLLLSLIVIILFLSFYILPPLFAARFIADFSDDLKKRFDWIGLERTFKKILLFLKEKTENQYQMQKKIFLKKKLPKIIINISCLAGLISIICVICFVF